MPPKKTKTAGEAIINRSTESQEQRRRAADEEIVDDNVAGKGNRRAGGARRKPATRETRPVGRIFKLTGEPYGPRFRYIDERPEEESSDDEPESDSEDESRFAKEDAAELPSEFWHMQKLIKYTKAGDQTATTVSLCLLRDYDLSSRAIQRAIREMGGPEVLVNLLETKDSKCQHGALAVISAMASSSVETRRCLVDFGIVPPLMEMLKHPAGDMRILAAETMASVATVRKARKQIRVRSGVGLILDAMDVPDAILGRNLDRLDETEKELVAVAIGCAKVLGSLSISPKIKEELRKHGVVFLMARFLRSVHTDLVVAIMGAVQRCADLKVFRLAFEQMGMIVDIVRHLSSTSDNLKLKENCALAIFKCASNKLTRDMVREAGGLDSICELLKSEQVRRNKRLLGAVTGAIWKCAISPENVARFNRYELVASLVSLLDENEDEDVLTNVVGSLAECCKDPANRTVLRINEALPKLIRLLSVTYEPLLENLPLVLKECAEDEECMNVINDSSHSLDGVRLLWSLLKHPSNPVKRNACWALVPCIKYAKDSAEMVRAFVGGLELAVSLLESKDNQVLAAACATIAQIATDPENLGILTDHGVVKMLADLIETEDENLRANLTLAIAFCCEWEQNNYEFGRLNAVAPLVNYANSKDKNVLKGVSIAFYHLSKEPLNCVTMHTCGVIKHVLRLVGSEDPEVQIAAATTIRNIRKLALATEKFHLREICDFDEIVEKLTRSQKVWISEGGKAGGRPHLLKCWAGRQFEQAKDRMAGTRAVTVYAGSVLFSLLVLALYVLGAARYLTNLEENTCQMTYMFEYPQYVRIALKDEIEERYPRFGLYAYGEGHATEKHRRMKFSGIPVLFVPGNAGSHEQVRSLASVSLRKSIKDRTPFHFDYFTVSLGKDYSAFYGGVLEDETAYVLLCVKKILSLYKGSMDNIVLIGHSMGGIVAKSALLRGALVSSLSNDTAERTSFASILVTLASPHKPIFLPDRTIARFYEELAQLEYRRRPLNAADTSFVSIGGGRRDILVSASQTIDPSADLNLVSSGIPGVWTSTDHLCILWCKQLVLTIVRALFDCVDVNARPPKIHSDPKANIRALSYHFTSGIDGKKRRRKYAEKWKFEAGGEWTEDVRRRYTWSGSANGHTNKTMFLMIRFDEASLTSYDSISIDAINLESRDWLFACSAHAIEANSRVCEWGWNITNRTRLLSDPRQHRSRMSVDIERKDLRGWKISHVVVRIPMEELRDKRSAASSVKIHVDLYNRVERTIRLEDRTISAGATELFGFLPIGGGLWSPNPYSVVTSLQGSLRYYAVLADIRDAVNVEIEVLPDGTRSTDRQPARFDKNEDESPRAIFELTETSSFDDRQTSSSSSQVRAVVANDKKDGQFAKKQRRFVVYLTRKKNDAVLRMSFGPEYSYRVEIRRAGIVDRVACLVRDKWPNVYPIIISLCLLGIATRLDSSPRTLTITLGIFILAATIFDFLVETLVALGLLHVVAITACCLIVAFGTVTHNVATRFLARIVSIPSSWFDWLMGGFDRLPILTTFILLSLASVSCGAVAMLLCVPLYFLKLTKMYEDYLEELFMASVRHLIPRFGRAKRKRKRRGTSAIESSSSDNVNGPNDEKSLPAVDVASASTKMSKGLLLNNLLLFVTWSFAAIPAMPSALVWATNFRHETRLSTEDTTMLFSWLVLTCWHSLGHVEIPIIEARPNENNRRIFSANLLRLLAYLIAFTTAIEKSAYYQWIVPPLVALAATSLALLSLFPGDPR